MLGSSLFQKKGVYIFMKNSVVWNCVKVGFGLGLGVQLSIVAIGAFAGLVTKENKTNNEEENKEEE